MHGLGRADSVGLEAMRLTNQDGTSMGIIAPNSLAQTDVIQPALEDGKINPNEVTYIETHETGTALGDPIEVEEIKRAFNKYTDKKQFCALSSKFCLSSG